MFRRSTSGAARIFAGAAIEWRSKRQATVSLSSSEAEYVAAAEASRAVVYVRQLLAHLCFAQRGPTPLLLDSQAAIGAALQEANNQRRKHIDAKHHYLREQVLNGVIELRWVPTAEQAADIFTKALPRAAFAQHRATVMNLPSDSGHAHVGRGQRTAAAAAQPDADADGHSHVD